MGRDAGLQFQRVTGIFTPVLAGILAGVGAKEALLAREDLIEVEGVITDVHPGGMFTVKLDQGPAIQARVGGKMRQHFIRIVLGDRVKVGVSPYDPTHGIITYRSK